MSELKNGGGMMNPGHQNDEALYEQREWLRVTLSCIGDGVITTDNKGHVTFLNPVTESLTGWTQEEAAGKSLDSVFRIVNGTSRDTVENSATKALRAGVVVGLANHTLLIAKDGTERPIDDSAAPIRNAAGEVAGVVLVFRDVTERKRQEQQVQDALAYADNILATLQEPFLVLDQNLRVVTANRSFYEDFHVVQEETQGRFVYDLGNRQWDIPELRTLLEDVLPQNHTIQDFEVEQDFSTLGRKVMLLNACRIRQSGNHSELILLAIKDVTEQRRVTQQTQDAMAYAQNIVDTVREPLLILDATLRVRSANRAFYQTFHVSPRETEGRLIYELGNGQWDIPDLRTLLEDIVPTSSVFDDFELEHTFPDIGRRVMLLNARKLQANHHGELLVLAMEDVTARKRAEELLVEAGALQSAIFNSANFSSIATDAKGVIQIFNVGAERMLGYTAAEVMNKITPADISDPRELIARAVALSLELDTPITPGFEALVFKAARGIEDIYELTYFRKDGSRFPAVVSVTALRDAQDAIIGYLLIGTDNTARKQAEEALLKAGALQNAIFNSANFSSIATDEKGVIQIFNVGAERMLGYTAAEVMNRITPADISDPRELIARAKSLSVELNTPITPGFEALVFKASRGIEDIYELTYIRKDGSRFPAIVSVTALRDANGGIIGYLLIGTDNTARQLVEAERMLLDQRVRDQQFYTRSLIESNIDALITTDPRGIITDVNKQMEALTGCTRDELIGAPFKDYFTDPERAKAGIKLVLAEGKVTDYELTACARDGQETVVSYNATTFHDRDRKLQGVFVAARDVTERSRLENQMREQKAKLSDLHRRKDEFLALLSHELRSPLAPISNAVQLLGLNRGSENLIQKQARGIIERQLRQLQHLVDDLLEVSRITTGRVLLRRERVAMFDILERAVETARPLIEKRRHEFTVSLPPEPIWLYADAARLEQVVVNLLTNATKYTEEEGHLWLTVQQEGDECVLRVRDTGVGITPALLPRIFDMFTQAERSLDRSQGGLGIGLALVQRLTELHGGKVEVDSELGQGSEFIVRLPVALPDTPQPPSTVTETSQPSVRPLRVLLVDDNVDTVLSFSMLIEAHGHDVRTAHDGLSGVQAAIDYQPDVALLDIGLPGLNGYEVAKRIRQHPNLENVVLVALTGYGQESDREASRQAGFNHHLVKPALLEQLQQVLTTVSEKLNVEQLGNQ